jgi:hypothetical protein
VDDSDYDYSAYPFRWTDVIHHFLDTGRYFFSGLATTAKAHHNYKIDRERFHEDAAREIERLTEGE